MTDTQTAWPKGVIARYLTVAGTADPNATVDIETLSFDDGEPYSTLSICRGCQAREEQEYGLCRNYGDEGDRARASQREAREWAQSHAEKCRALPRPTT